MAAFREVKLHWFDNQDVAWAFARSQVFRVKRTGYPRYLNLLAILITLPLRILAFVPLAFLLAVAAVAWVVWRISGRSNQAFFDSLTRRSTHIARSLSWFSSHLGMNAIDPSAYAGLRRFFDNRPTILYLRPFKMDNRMAVAPNDLPLTLEGLIRNMTRSIGPLIALGRDDDVTDSRAERIQVSDHTWRAEVVELMRSSGHIVVVPENTQGTMWEIEQILDDVQLMRKTIFLNIAAAGRDHPYWARARTVYGDDDGKVFLDTLTRITESDVVKQIPLAQIAGVAVIHGEPHVFCAERLFDAGLWSALPRIVIFLKSQSGSKP